MRLIPKKWEEFQHYKDRAPAWIKLHRALLDDFAFSCLPVASRALAPMLWLLASEYSDGEISATWEELAFRLRMSVSELEKTVKPLIDAKFFTLEQDASTTLAPCLPREEIEKSKRREDTVDLDFENFKKEYPKRNGSNPWKPAHDLFRQAVKSGHDLKTIISAARTYRHECERNGIVNTDKVAQAQTWLRQSRFLDYLGYVEPAAGPAIPDEMTVELFKKGVRWNPAFGPEPGMPGCRAPAELLERYGYKKDAA